MFAFKILHRFARALDVLFSSLIVAPLVVVYWFTAWTIFNNFIFPEEQVKSASLSFVIGFIGQFVVMFFQESFAKHLTFTKHPIVNVIVTKVFALLIALTTISLWRGTWMIADMTSPDDNFSIALNFAQNAMILMLTKSFRNSIAALFVVTLDHSENNFYVPTYFKRLKADGVLAFFADCICTCLLMVLTVAVWRDVWTLVQLNFFPEDYLLSGYFSLAIGFVLTVIGYAGEDLVRKLYRSAGVCKILFHDSLILICLLATVFVWRGLWTMLDVFFGTQLEILFILNGVSWKLLMVMHCTNSLAGKGLLIDCDDEEFELPYKYFRFHLNDNQSASKCKEEGKVNEAFDSTQM